MEPLQLHFDAKLRRGQLGMADALAGLVRLFATVIGFGVAVAWPVTMPVRHCASRRAT